MSPEKTKTEVVPREAKMADAIGRAKAAQKMRKKAPMTIIGTESTIHQKTVLKRIRDRYVKDGVEPPNSLYIPETSLKDYAESGYWPEIDTDGEAYKYHGDIVVSCPMEQYREVQKVAVARSQRFLKAGHKKVQGDAPDGSTVEAVMRKGHKDGTSEVVDLMKDG